MNNSVSIRNISSENFIAINKKYNLLDLSMSDFKNLTIEQLIVALRAIPEHIKFISFCMSNLDFRSTSDLESMFINLPKTIIGIDLKSNYLNKKQGNELNIILQAIPHTVIKVNLGCNNLSDVVELSSAFTNIKASQISLYKNNLSEKSTDELVLTFSSISPSITHLDLSSNNLGNKTTSELASIFNSFSENITHLNLSNNNLSQKTADELAFIFSSMSKSITHLDLSSDYFGSQPADAIISIFSNMPLITYVNLRNNDLEQKSAFDLSRIISSLPLSTIKLDLSNNKLSDVDLTILAQSTPNSIQEIDLRDNGLDNKSTEQLMFIFEGFKESVHKIKVNEINFTQTYLGFTTRKFFYNFNTTEIVRYHLLNKEQFNTKTTTFYNKLIDRCAIIAQCRHF